MDHAAITDRTGDCLLAATGIGVDAGTLVIGIALLVLGAAVLTSRTRGRAAHRAASASLLVVAVTLVAGATASSPAHADTAHCLAASPVAPSASAVPAPTPTPTPASTSTPAPTPTTTPTTTPAPEPTPTRTPTPPPRPTIDLALAFSIEVPGYAVPQNVPTRLTGRVDVQNLSGSGLSGGDVTFRIPHVDDATDFALASATGWTIDTTSDPDATVFVHAGPLAAGETTTVAFTFTFTYAFDDPSNITYRLKAALDDGTGGDDDPTNNTAWSNIIPVIIEL